MSFKPSTISNYSLRPLSPQKTPFQVDELKTSKIINVYKVKVYKTERKKLSLSYLLVKTNIFPFFLPFVVKCVTILSMLDSN